MSFPVDVPETAVLLDTNVASYLFRQDSRANFFRPFFVRRTVAVSFMTAAELYFGAYKARWGPRRLARLGAFLRNYVLVPFDAQLSQEWARVRSENQAKGHGIEHADAWIAATARLHNCVLATNNARHFAGIEGLIIISPPNG